MKKTLLLASLLLMFVISLSGCKKEDTDSLKYKITGKWEVSRIEPSPVLSITSGDYYEFKEGDDDMLEVRRGGQVQTGTYSVTVSNELYLTLGGATYTCKVTTIEDNKLEFTSSSAGVSEKVYLVR